jgi:hypothetical protein
MTHSTDLQQATTLTSQHLRGIARSQPIRQLSKLTLPEIDSVVDVIAQIIPAASLGSTCPRRPFNSTSPPCLVELNRFSTTSPLARSSPGRRQ